MVLEPGKRFGSFEVVERIGSGGMGEVWRARDSTLHRDVALKVLPARQHPDPDAAARFEREARLLAALNHPNIATLHGLESAAGTQALVMELVEGEGLDARIARAPDGLPIGEALEIAAQIATALEAAHERGILHRDLKPANVKIRPDGTVKVLDFGIAKAIATDDGPSTVSTVTQMPGAIVGTPSYMSPEQASGAEVDRRTDIWAFGCVLYEMLTGQRVFDGDTNSRILARVLERDPDWGSLPRGLHPRIRALLQQCLEKNVRRRRRDAGDVRLELESAAAEPAGGPPDSRARGAGTWLAWSAITAVVAAAAAGIALFLQESPPPAQVVTSITTENGTRQNQFALSPNGRYIAYVADSSDDSVVPVLFVRDLQSGESARLSGTEWARNPCWSPDSRSIAFFAVEALLRVDIALGNPARLARAANGGSCSWSDSGHILFTPNAVSPLYSVSQFPGGEARQVTQLNLVAEPGAPDHELVHGAPSFIPGTDFFVYGVNGGRDAVGIYLGSLESGSLTRLIAINSAGTFVAPDWLVYSQGDRLVAHRLDLEARSLTDERVEIAESIDSFGGNAFSATRNGERIAFRQAGATVALTRILDSNGETTGIINRTFNGIALSPDEQSLGFGGPDVWISDLDGSGVQRIVGDPTAESFPEFSPEGGELIYEKQRTDDKIFELWKVGLASREAEFFYSEAEDLINLIPIDWSSNGYLLTRRTDLDFLSTDLIAVSTGDPGEPPIEIAVTDYEERLGEFSPSGDYVVYDSTRPGQFGIFVQAFPDASADSLYTVTDFGFAPRWNGDEEIVFLTLDGRIMAARVTRTDSGLEIGTPAERARARVGEPGFQHPYEITRDGRILISVFESTGPAPPITLIQNPAAFR